MENMSENPTILHEITFNTHDIGAELKLLLEDICQGVNPPREFQLNFEENGTHTLSFSMKQGSISTIVASLSQRHPKENIRYCQRMEGTKELLKESNYRNGMPSSKQKESKKHER